VHNGVEVTSEYLENHPLLRAIAGRRHIPLEPRLDPLPPPTQFVQRLDHFNPVDNRTFNQRVVVDKQFWSPGGPIFIFMDGEAPMTFFPFQEATPFYWAKKYGAMYISLEHRYYGKSLPFAEFTTQNMQYLSSQQALADTANFIDQYNKTISNPGPWIVFGCSYSGALSSWFRAKYPNSVIASVAPSGPVFAQANFTQYYGQFETSCDLIGYPTCVSAVQSAVSSISQMLSTPSGISQLETIFKTCQPINTTDTPNWFFELVLMEQVGGADQMDNAPDWPLNATCDMMTSSTDYVQNWANTFGNASCNPFSQTEWIKLMSLPIPSSNRAWFWQKCTEFGFFKPSYEGTSVFWGDVHVDPMIGWCEQIFGVPGMQPNTDWTNTFYGGYDLKASNVLFTNGLLDPWHNLSINEDNGRGVQAVTYEAGHCATMDLPYPAQDPPSLVVARTVVDQFLQQVLDGYYYY